MLFDSLCSKIYFWPFLSYLASLKGLCPFPTTVPTVTPIPTFQPTPPTTQIPCPAEPLVCLAGGERPIPYCPCIDPRQNGLTATPAAVTTGSYESLQNQRLQLNLLYTTTVTDNDVMIFSHLDDSKRRRKRKKRVVL